MPLKENLNIAVPLLERCHKSEIILEVEAGVVGGEEDGVSAEDAPAEKLFTTPEDMLEVAVASEVKGARFLLAATFGNVHGVYKPGHVKLKPSILKMDRRRWKRHTGKMPVLISCFMGARVHHWKILGKPLTMVW